MNFNLTVLRKLFWLLFLFHFSINAFSQDKGSGVIAGNIMDEKKKALNGATVQLVSLADTLILRSTTSDKHGEFNFTGISFGYYKLAISFVGLQTLSIDSIWLRPERYDFNLSEIILKPGSANDLAEFIVYAEKPLIESKEGNITFNAGESALAAGSTASDLLTQVPLVAKDPDGKITVRGKEPKILIDDKPVELNLQQLQDLLESMPGSSIEKIEVMTNPPAQYANEEGGVINIVTRKGKAGISGRIAASAGTRGDRSVNGSFSYRKQGLAININAGTGFNRFTGNGYSTRNNIYKDSSNFFNTLSNYRNKSLRPNLRANIDYEINKKNLLNITFNFNSSDFQNANNTEYRNINRFDELWKLSRRLVKSEGSNVSPSLNFSYTWKRKLGETLRIISSYHFSSNGNDRDFYQQFFHPDESPTGQDSTQQLLNTTRTNGHSLRVNYDKMLNNKKTFLSVGTVYNRSNDHIIIDATYKRKADGEIVKMENLSNDLWFHQTVTNARASLKQTVGKNFSVTAGVSVEKTGIWFELLKENRDAKNDYWTWLPFFNVNKSWKDKLNLRFTYRKTIRRPGMSQMNPTVDLSDPYTTRFGNEKLEASNSHNFDIVIGKTKPLYYLNLGMGYNVVEDIFSQVRTLLPDGKTQVTWENISGRKEYELSTWNGLTIAKKLKVNFNASYIFSQYSEFDIRVRKFRNGGSFTSNINGNYSLGSFWNFTGSYNVNRFANPQGFARWTTSMNLGIQRKLLNKKMTITLNAIDPFVQQRNRVFTYGTNFKLESFNTTNTKNYKLSLAYNLVKTTKKKTTLDKVKRLKK